jgi:hypothetical protein
VIVRVYGGNSGIQPCSNQSSGVVGIFFDNVQILKCRQEGFEHSLASGARPAAAFAMQCDAASFRGLGPLELFLNALQTRQITMKRNYFPAARLSALGTCQQSL